MDQSAPTKFQVPATLWQYEPGSGDDDDPIATELTLLVSYEGDHTVYVDLPDEADSYLSFELMPFLSALSESFATLGPPFSDTPPGEDPK